ncbi:uncharacterized protein LOC110176588 [Drosophila serrata]|uniref:uncharacterized protein LOC110176588 n=1 Tax=Drosophila serrata TaxID=7274 RepID=UPI000A1D1942|nr:uncharacterized protein LOC110176588 [Drosophila serrata]
MDSRLGLLIALLLAAVQAFGALETPTNPNVSENGLLRTVRHVYGQCADSEDVFWCCKIQGVRLLGRALKVPQLGIVDGVSLVRRESFGQDTRSGRASLVESQLSNRDLEHMSGKSLDALLLDRFLNFVHSHELQVNLPRLLRFGERNGQDWLQHLLSYFLPASRGESEGRKKKDDKKYLGPFIAAVLLKTAIMKMAYHSIAIVAGKALVVGKIALIISAIIGLRRLVGQAGQSEKTTYEIVKHPQVQQSHTYSSSHQGEYDTGHDGGSYHRSIDDEMMMQDKAYQAWMPQVGATASSAVKGSR